MVGIINLDLGLQIESMKNVKMIKIGWFSNQT